MSIPLIFHATGLAEQDLSILLTFREMDGQAFHSKRLVRRYDIRPIMTLGTSSYPSQLDDHPFVFNLEIENTTVSTGIRINQITTLSPTWSCTPLNTSVGGMLGAQQTARFTFGADWLDKEATVTTLQNFVSGQLRSMLLGSNVDESQLPPIDLSCNHFSKNSEYRSVKEAATRHFIHSGRRNTAAHAIAAAHEQIPSQLHSSIFPLYHPHSVDFVAFWEIPSQDRSGHVLFSGLRLGASHAALREVIEEAENAKVKRSMYAETHRKRQEILAAARRCEWNAEMDPLEVVVQDGMAVEHDFSRGPCHAIVAFSIRNHSLTHPAKYTIKFSSKQDAYPTSSDLLPPQYAGRLTHRGQLMPLESAVIHTKLLVSRPGTYALDGWQLYTEVAELPLPDSSSEWQIRDRYEQVPLMDRRPFITVLSRQS